MLTGRFATALQYAFEVHSSQPRKGTAIPYVAHLLAVAALVLEAGGGEDEAIAALLHDAAEDGGGAPRLADIRSRFGERVAAIVEACSDSLAVDPASKLPWPDRKRPYVEHLRGSADRGHLLVACADKLHNARAMLQDHRAVGARLWKRFGVGDEKTAAMIVGYYDAVAEALAAGLPGPMSAELRSVVSQLVKESGLTPDRRWEAAAH